MLPASGLEILFEQQTCFSFLANIQLFLLLLASPFFRRGTEGLANHEIKPPSSFKKKASKNSYGLSCALSWIFLLFYTLLLFAVFFLPLNSLLAVCLLVCLSIYCFYLLRKYFLINHPYSIKKIIFTELGWCYVQLNNYEVFKAEVDSDTILSEHLVILNLIRIKNGNQSLFKKIFIFLNRDSVFITADRIGKKKFREIKRYFRFINFSNIT